MITASLLQLKICFVGKICVCHEFLLVVYSDGLARNVLIFLALLGK